MHYMYYIGVANEVILLARCCVYYKSYKYELHCMCNIYRMCCMYYIYFNMNTHTVIADMSQVLIRTEQLISLQAIQILHVLMHYTHLT